MVVVGIQDRIHKREALMKRGANQLIGLGIALALVLGVGRVAEASPRFRSVVTAKNWCTFRRARRTVHW